MARRSEKGSFGAVEGLVCAEVIVLASPAWKSSNSREIFSIEKGSLLRYGSKVKKG